MSDNEQVPVVGSRLKCSECGAQVVVVKIADRAVKCCGKTLEKQ